MAITPAIKQAVDEGIVALGSLPSRWTRPDGFTRFDAILAMYHDQGLTPFKAICFDSGVNYTVGLPAIRTSPDHGTAYDLAGQNLANPNSFRSALYLAIDIFNNRRLHDQPYLQPFKHFKPG